MNTKDLISYLDLQIIKSELEQKRIEQQQQATTDKDELTEITGAKFY